MIVTVALLIALGACCGNLFQFRGTRRIVMDRDLAVALTEKAVTKLNAVLEDLDQAEHTIKELEEVVSDALADQAVLQERLAALQTLWIVGQYRFGDTPNVVWDLQGVFSSEAKAVAACKTPTWFVARIELDHEAPESTRVLPEVKWPLIKEAE